MQIVRKALPVQESRAPLVLSLLCMVYKLWALAFDRL